MKTLYIDCPMGAAGDMLAAALLELLPDKSGFIDKINSIGIPGVSVSAVPSVKCGITGTRAEVKINGKTESTDTHTHAHSHSSMAEIEGLIAGLDIPDDVKKDTTEVYHLLAEAESQAHGVSIPDVHFHEVGTLDAVADIVSVCMLIHMIAPEKIVVSPVNTGSGSVKCAHGILPVPAPATAYILRGVPIYSGDIKSELCTPTGAALIKHFAHSFGNMPAMRLAATGYGMGEKDFDAANCVRAMLGETEENGGFIVELSCNVDDMTAEAIGFATERFFAAGALEVYTVNAGMKKNRPGTVIYVMCTEEKREVMLREIFRHTSTIGVRENVSRRYTLARTIQTEETEFGIVRKKTSEGYGVRREKYEYDDIARIARETGMSVREVLEVLRRIKYTR